MVQKAHPNLSASDRMVVISHMWNGLTESQKEPYKEAEKRAKEKY